MSPGCPMRKIFISEISIHSSGKGKGGDSELCRRKGKEIFLLSLLLEGWVLVRGSPLSTEIRAFPADSEPRAERPVDVRVCVCCSFFSSRTRHPAGQGRAGSARQAPALCGVPPRCPPPSQESWCRGRQEGFFLPQERSSLRQGGEGTGGGGPGSSLPHGRCLTGSPKSPGDYGTGSRPLGAAAGGPGGLTETRGPAAAAPRSSPSPAARLLGSRRASFPLM